MVKAIKRPVGKKKAMPGAVAPMLCTLMKEPPDDPEYLYEIKWDGYRIISFAKAGKVTMGSRSGLDYTRKYPPVAAAIKKLGQDVVLDGEVVVFNEEDKPDFDALQKYNGHNTPIYYCVFDILWLNGYDLTSLPLTERKEILKKLVDGHEGFRYSESFDDGPALYEQIQRLNMEGIVAKKRGSSYHPGERGSLWLKTPTRVRQEFVIGAWAESDKSRAFKSLLFGAYQGGELHWIGRSGGGYKEKEMAGILAKLKKLEIDHSPFVNQILDTKGAVIHYVKPELVANFEFATWTKTGRIRKPATFLGFRLDKKPRQVVREVPADLDAPGEVDANPPARKNAARKSSTKHRYLNADSGWEKVDAMSTDEVSDFELEDCTIQLTDVDRELWKGVLTKGELLVYYSKVAKVMLPHLKDRPQSLNLKLVNAGAQTTFIKDMEDRQPACAAIYTEKRRVKTAGKRDIIDYLVCNNASTLLYMVNLGCIDINPWASRTTSPNEPDYFFIDLDPTVTGKKTEDSGFKKAIDIALASREVLDKYKLRSFIKTSGKTGMHIYVPCRGLTNGHCRRVASAICDEIFKLIPRIATRNNTVDLRGNKVYIDDSQNDHADTLAAPYSVRPYHVPLVSTPLDWKEVNEKLDRKHFTMEAVLERVERKGDLFYKVLDDKIGLANSKHLQSFF